jgi:hypothetical protein
VGEGHRLRRARGRPIGRSLARQVRDARIRRKGRSTKFQPRLGKRAHGPRARRAQVEPPRLPFARLVIDEA